MTEEESELANDTTVEAVTLVDGWEDVMSNPAISNEDFVDIDKDVAVCGELTDADIVVEELDKAEQDGNDASGDENADPTVAEENPIPSTSKAAKLVEKLWQFFERKNLCK